MAVNHMAIGEHQSIGRDDNARADAGGHLSAPQGFDAHDCGANLLDDIGNVARQCIKR